MTKRVCIFLLVLAMVFSAVGCASQNGSASPAQPEQPAENAQSAAPETEKPSAPAEEKIELPSAIVIATSASTGTWLPVGTGLSELLADHGGIKATPQTTSGSNENIRLVSSGEVEIGMTGISNLTLSAKTGTGAFEGEKIENVKVLFGALPNAIQVLVKASSDMTSVKDLAGKKVCTGPVGSYSTTVLNLIMDKYGLTYEEINMPWGDSYEALQDGDLDCIFVIGAYPNSGITSMATSTPLRYIKLTEEEMTWNLENDATVYKQVIPAGTYPGMDTDYATIANPTAFIVSSDMDEAVAYELTRLIMENVRDYDSYSNLMVTINAETALGGIAMEDLHPGALRYFQETNNPGIK